MKEKEKLSPDIKKDIDDASKHLAACWILLSCVMQHADAAEDIIKKHGFFKFNVKRYINGINSNFDVFNNWFTNLSKNSKTGYDVFRNEYIKYTGTINELLGFDGAGYIKNEN